MLIGWKSNCNRSSHEIPFWCSHNIHFLPVGQYNILTTFLSLSLLFHFLFPFTFIFCRPFTFTSVFVNVILQSIQDLGRKQRNWHLKLCEDILVMKGVKLSIEGSSRFSQNTKYSYLGRHVTAITSYSSNNPSNSWIIWKCFKTCF